MKPEDIELVAGVARDYAGLKLRGDRAFHIETRLATLARREGLASPELLVEQLRDAPDEALRRAVTEALTQGETAFFRDRKVFERLQLEILPTLAAQRPDGLVRVLSAGCSTGQEPYSLALSTQAAAGPSNLDILGVDLNERALEKAQSGIYTQFEVQRGLPIRMLINSFERMEDMWIASPRLRQMVRWRRVNLLEDLTALGTFDLILCRNVMSCLEGSAREAVMKTMHGLLADDGWIVLGAQESVEDVDGFLPGRGFGLHRKDSGSDRRAA